MKTSKFLFFASIIIIGSSCKKEFRAPASDEVKTSPAVAINTITVSGTDNVTLDLTTANQDTRQIPIDFTGLSFEKRYVTFPDYFNASNTKFVNLVKGLGTGVIRVGAYTVDVTEWHGTENRNGSTSSADLYVDDNWRFANFVTATGWSLIYGLNFHVNEKASNNASDAYYIYGKLGSKVISYEIGNEPDNYRSLYWLRRPGFNYMTYRDSIPPIQAAVLGRVPTASFCLPALTSSNYLSANNFSVWYYNSSKPDSGLIYDINHHNLNNINMISVHSYKSPGTTVDQLMDVKGNTDLQRTTTNGLNIDNTLLTTPLPFRLDECNSVYSGGTNGVSNTFASSMYGANFMFWTAIVGYAGVNFHGGTPKVSGSTGSWGGSAWYTPIDVTDSTGFIAKPLYYGMLLYKLADVNYFLRGALVSNPSSAKMDVYAFNRRSDSKKGVVLINREHNTAVQLNITNGTAITSANIHTLANYNSALTDPNAVLTDANTSDTRIDGASVNSNGTWSGTATTVSNNNTNKSIFTYTVPPLTAVLIIF